MEASLRQISHHPPLPPPHTLHGSLLPSAYIPPRRLILTASLMAGSGERGTAVIPLLAAWGAGPTCFWQGSF